MQGAIITFLRFRVLGLAASHGSVDFTLSLRRKVVNMTQWSATVLFGKGLPRWPFWHVLVTVAPALECTLSRGWRARCRRPASERPSAWRLVRRGLRERRHTPWWPFLDPSVAFSGGPGGPSPMYWWPFPGVWVAPSGVIGCLLVVAVNIHWECTVVYTMCTLLINGS